MSTTVDILCFISICITPDDELFTVKYAFNLETLIHMVVRAWREQHGSTSEIDSIAKAVFFYAGGQCTPRPKNSWKMWE